MPISGEADFTVPATGYVAGVPAGGGQGNVQIEFAVTEKSTVGAQQTIKLLTVAQSSLVLTLQLRIQAHCCKRRSGPDERACRR